MFKGQLRKTQSSYQLTTWSYFNRIKMKDEIQITKLEIALIVGIVGCLLLATWELGNLMVTDWLKDWVMKNEFTNKRIILYGIAFSFSILALWVTVKTVNRDTRFIYAINRSLLWYGSLLLISTICIFVFDCLPEVAAGIIGAVIFATAIYYIQKNYFSEDRIALSRRKKGQCPSCGFNIDKTDKFCKNCGFETGKTCSNCHADILKYDRFCKSCGLEFK